MKRWESFYLYVLPDVPGCPNPIADQALVRAAREFCERTLVWEVDTDPTTTVVDVAEYDFDTGLNQEVVAFLSATLNGRELDVVSEKDLPADWRSNRTSQRDCAFTQDCLTFTIVPTPAAAYDLTTKFAVRPSLNAIGVDDRIFAQFCEQIAYGAKAILMATKDKPYSDAGLSAFNRAKFDAAINVAAIKHERGNTRRRRRVNALNF